MKFEYYVLNEDFNKQCVKHFNIFSNIHVNNRTEQEVKRYVKDPDQYTYTRYSDSVSESTTLSGFQAFCESIRCIIMSEEWARCEYEIMVGSLFEQNPGRLEKIDCYYQCELNIPCIAREVIYQYQNKCGMNGKAQN